MMKTFRVIGLSAIFAALCAVSFAAAKKPVTFIETNEPGWSSIEIREGLSEDEVWNTIVDIIAKSFQIQLLSKDSGYLRTSWSYSWATGKTSQKYRVRLVVKINYAKNIVDIRSEANYLINNVWVEGTDTRLLQTVKRDMSGLISRVTQ
ncbi:MAG: hypothetical protein LHW48_01615 [Candidatus Cloacimonetes bacterium]|nr:hypothetical protein [Candidatus Cloacimonadota bacterium]